MNAQDVTVSEGRMAPGVGDQSFEALLDGWNRKHGLREYGRTAGHGVESSDLRVIEPAGRCPGSPDVTQWVEQLTRESQELTRRIHLMEAEIKQLRRARQEVLERERACAISAVTEMMGLLGIPGCSIVDLAPIGPAVVSPDVRPEAETPKAPRYRGPQGQVWLGRGRYPKWLKTLLDAGGSLSDYSCLSTVTADGGVAEEA